MAESNRAQITITFTKDSSDDARNAVMTAIRETLESDVVAKSKGGMIIPQKVRSEWG